MPQTARLVIPNCPHHVIQRGNRRQRTFFNDDNYQYYIDLLAESCQLRAEDWPWNSARAHLSHQSDELCNAEPLLKPVTDYSSYFETSKAIQADFFSWNPCFL